MLDAGTIVRVQIEDLKQYAAELETEIAAVKDTSTWLEVSPQFGTFAEASALGGRMTRSWRAWSTFSGRSEAVSRRLKPPLSRSRRTTPLPMRFRTSG